MIPMRKRNLTNSSATKTCSRVAVVALWSLAQMCVWGGGGGCASGGNSKGSPYAPLSESSRDTVKAQALTQKAADLIVKDPDEAEMLLREALTADISFGPAHNDLGVIELNRGQWYEAASEFEWARKLMPGHPDPRMNLALTLEKAGRVDEALAAYNSALEVYPNHIPTMQALARLQIRHNVKDGRTSEFLKEVALAGDTPQWRSWAQEQLVFAQAVNGASTKPKHDDAPTADMPKAIVPETHDAHGLAPANG